MESERAGGGLPGGSMASHNRQNSEPEVVSVPESAPQSNVPSLSNISPPPETTEEQRYPESSSQLPRRFSQTSKRPQVPQVTTTSLSRNPSTCSNTSARQNEHFSTTPPESAPAPATTTTAITTPPASVATSDAREACALVARSPSLLLPRRTERPRIEPPVTKLTLSELDPIRIICNPKLRHDVNFDPDLHFRPNIDGDKGRRKQERASQFWATLQNQLTQALLDRDAFLRDIGGSGEWCLTSLLMAVRDILLTLVPKADRNLVSDGLNTDLFMQQLYQGVFDLEKLASWLSHVLKLHCAPMRDEWVEAMYHHLSRGNQTCNTKMIVRGLKSLLGLLEAMKLDVANHQIRCLRPGLIEETVQFEQRFFSRKIQSGRFSVRAAHAWYQSALTKHTWQLSSSNPEAESSNDRDNTINNAMGDMTVFFRALTRLLLPSVAATESVQNTFFFDEERIMKLRVDVYDAICLGVCTRMFDGFHSAVARHRGVLVPASEATARAAEFSHSILAFLCTVPATTRLADRWQSLIDPIAIEMTRDFNLSLVPDVTRSLSRNLCVSSDLFRDAEQSVHQRLLTELSRRVREMRNLPGVDLFARATSNNNRSAHQSSRPRGDSASVRHTGQSGVDDDDACLADMASRLAHLGILHWRVWADLAYLSPAEPVLSPSPSVSSASAPSKLRI